MSRILEALTERDFDLFEEVCHVTFRAQAAKEKADKVRRFTANCHTVALVIASSVPDLTLRHGQYVSLYFAEEDGKVFIKNLCEVRHTWLETPDGAIIDPRPVSFTTHYPVLLPSMEKSLESLAGMYHEDAEVKSVSTRKTILRRAAILLEFMKEKAAP
jgi:hypothetical protein